MQKNDSNKGCLVISLDFELMWGCHEWSEIAGYGMSNVANVREVITKMLALFKKYNVHATFATVGMIMAKDKEDLQSYLPDLQPKYKAMHQSPYKEGFIDGIKKDEEFLFFAPDVIEQLKATDGIEIGTHTFSHYYCWSPGQSAGEFDADLESAVKLAKANGVEIKSIVFPKNEVDDEYLSIVAKHGITSYRGNANHFFNQPKTRWESLRMKLGRIADAYLPIANNLIEYSEITSTNGVTNIKASRIFRPYSRMLRFFEPLRIRRIKGEIKKAAKQNKIYHLWWHPHNFGANADENLKNLEEVLKAYSKYSRKYGMVCRNMQEVNTL